MKQRILRQRVHDLEAPIEVRGFGWFAMPQLEILRDWTGFRLLTAYALGQWVVVPRFHHWHHAIEAEVVPQGYVAQMAYPYVRKPGA